MDSSVSPTYGDQEGTAYNGHFSGCTCYHPLWSCSTSSAILERCALQVRSNGASAAHRNGFRCVWTRWSRRGIAGTRHSGVISVRNSAAFASPEVYEFLEAEGFKYAIRRSGRIQGELHDSIAHLLKRPRRSAVSEGHVRRYYAKLQLSGR